MNDTSTTEAAENTTNVSETSKLKQQLAAKIEAMPVGDAPLVEVPKRKNVGWSAVKAALLGGTIFTALTFVLSGFKKNSLTTKENIKSTVTATLIYAAIDFFESRTHNRWVDKVEKDNQNIQSKWTDKVNDMKSNLQQALWSK